MYVCMCVCMSAVFSSCCGRCNCVGQRWVIVKKCMTVCDYMDFHYQESAWASQEELDVCLVGGYKTALSQSGMARLCVVYGCIGWPAWVCQEELNMCVGGGCKAYLSHSGGAGLLCWWVMCVCVCVLGPVRKSWIIVMVVGMQSLLDPDRKSWTIVLCEGLWCSGWRAVSIRREVCWTVVGSMLISAVLSDCFMVKGSERLLCELCA